MRNVISQTRSDLAIHQSPRSISSLLNLRSLMLGAAAATLGAFAWPAVGQAQNLVVNPSFETPLDNSVGGTGLPAGCSDAGNWFYCPGTVVLGWDARWVSDNADGNMEFQTQATLGLTPSDGVQYTELGSHPLGDSRVRISQTVSLSLCPLDTYTLTYDHTRRESNDVLEVAVNDAAVAPTGPAPTIQSWNSYSVGIAPTGSSVKISFAEIGPAGTLGSLLDNVSLTNDFATSACPALDAKPGSNPNGVNLCSGGGVVPVAFVGTEYFDPNDYTIIGVSLVTDPGDDDFIVGKGKSEACKIEDVVDGTNPSEITPDGFDDIVCHIPSTDMSAVVDTSGETVAEVQVCLTVQDMVGGDPITICASDELKLARTCTSE